MKPPRSTKAVITSASVGAEPVTGVLPIQRIPGVTPEPRQTLTIRAPKKPKK